MALFLTNYQSLLIRCLKDEIKAYLSKAKTETAKEQKELARAWIFDDDYEPDSEFSCRRICEVLGHNITTLRMNVLFAEKKGMTLMQFINFRMKKGQDHGRTEDVGTDEDGEGGDEQE